MYHVISGRLLRVKTRRPPNPRTIGALDYLDKFNAEMLSPAPKVPSEKADAQWSLEFVGLG